MLKYSESMQYLCVCLEIIFAQDLSFKKAYVIRRTWPLASKFQLSLRRRPPQSSKSRQVSKKDDKFKMSRGLKISI